MFKNMKLKSRLILSFSVILFFTVLIAVLAIRGLNNANDEINLLATHAMAADSAVKLCRIETNVAARRLRDMVIDTDEKRLPTYKSEVALNIAQIKENITNLKLSYTGQDGLIEEYEGALNGWADIGNKIISTVENGNRADAQNMILTECTPALEKLIDIAKAITTNAEAFRDTALKSNQRSTNVSIIMIITLLAAAVVLSLAVAFKVTAGLVKRIGEVENAAVKMADGYLNSEIKSSSNDEIGQLAESMRLSMKIISEYISDIGRAMHEMARGNFNVKPTKPFIGDFKNIENSITDFVLNMNATLHSIQESSVTVDSAASQVSTSSQALAQGATEQAQEVDTLSASIAYIVAQIKQSAESAGVANKLAENVSIEISNGDKKMSELIMAMNEISNSSSEIGKIIKTIEDIAFQTNILALNAAVEAARAGEAGKGFAVVADEVRNLAAKSAEAAKNTTELIQSSISAVGNGTVLADDTAKAMKLVVTGTGEIREMIKKISEASNEETNSSEKITIGIDQIASVIQTNSATAEETAAASEELSGQADMLKHLVGKFTLI